MTKFNPGDRVICINADPMHGSHHKAPDWLVEGQIYTVSTHHGAAYETQPRPRLILEGLEAKIPYLERFQLLPPIPTDAEYLEILGQQELYSALKD